MSNDLNTTAAPHIPIHNARGKLRGSLAGVNPGQLLNLIQLARKTGTLYLYTPDKVDQLLIGGHGYTPEALSDEVSGSVAFRGGSIIRAHVAANNGDLADLLYRAGKIEADQMNRVRELGAGLSGKGHAMQIIVAGIVTQDDLLAALTEYTIDAVYEIMTWNEHVFVFEAFDTPDVDAITVTLDTRAVIKEGVLRTHEIRRLENALPNLDMILTFPPDIDERLRSRDLTVDEWRVISYVGPNMTVGQIAALCKLTESQIRQIVHGLMHAGLVKITAARRSGIFTRHQ